MQLKTNCFIIICIMLFVVGCRQDVLPKHREENSVTLSEAIEIGFEKIKKYGYFKKDFLVECDDNNTEWNEYIATFPSLLEEEDIKNMHLEEKEYWAVYYNPKEVYQKGGDAFVFIDRSSGEVIGVSLGK